MKGNVGEIIFEVECIARISFCIQLNREAFEKSLEAMRGGEIKIKLFHIIISSRYFYIAQFIL